MDCPPCRTRNPLEATNCSHCRAPLGGDAETLVAEQTPPAGLSTPASNNQTPTPSDIDVDATLMASTPSSMAIPSRWSVPASGQRTGDAPPMKVDAITAGVLLANRYEIVAKLGQGGMGAVYKARDRELDRFVALKVIRPDLAGQAEILQRFKQELILARKVTHRNVVRIFDLGEGDGIKFITMEYLDGRDLKSLLAQEGKLPPDRAIDIVQQVCLALEAAHSEGVVHRDLKPQNIMVDQQGRASVMDFGIARSLEFGGGTQTGALIGTPEYMSPEQVRGEHVDARSDLFTLGIIFQELLTGVLPYQADTAMASMYKRTRERAVSVHHVNPEIPQYLSDLVGKCLEMEPQDRYQSAREMYDALDAWKTGDAKPVRMWTARWFRRMARNRGAFGLVAAGAAVGIVLVAGVLAYRWKHPGTAAVVAHAPVSVLVADFTNNTGDPIFDDTLEPMFNVALEGASFINAYNRGSARQLASKLQNPSNKLDDQTARLVAIGQGVSAVVEGTLSSKGDGYLVTMKAIDPVSGKTLATTDLSAANKDDVLLDVPKLAAPIRKALGDTTSESAQLAATQGSFTTSNLEAVHDYGVGMEEQFAGNMQAALQSFTKASELDPNFARAYAGMAAAAGNLGQAQDAEKDAKLAMEHVDRMTERERFRIRGIYYIRTGNWQKCVDEYTQLTKEFPSDNIGQNNLASCYARLGNMPQAMQEGKRALDLAPKDVMAHNNFALYSCYAGDFQTCESEGRNVQKLNPSLEEGYLVLAYAQVGQGQLPQAIGTYQQLQKLGPGGASLAASGLADVALYEGRYRDAQQILGSGAAADVAAKIPDRAADKFIMLAYAGLLLHNNSLATSAAKKALANSQSLKIRFMAARTLVEAGDAESGKKMAEALASELQVEPQAYGKLVEGEAFLNAHDNQQALQSLTDAEKLLDTWLVHYELGLVYLEAGSFAEADSEFDTCIKRRGEALELFMDDMPTYSFLPDVYYYQGRARQGLKSAGFADSYRTYVSMRGKANEDLLLPEIRRAIQ